MDVDVIPLQSITHGRLNLKKGEKVGIAEAIAKELERVSLVEIVVIESSSAVDNTKSIKSSKAKAENSPKKQKSKPVDPLQTSVPKEDGESSDHDGKGPEGEGVSSVEQIKTDEDGEGREGQV